MRRLGYLYLLVIFSACLVKVGKGNNSANCLGYESLVVSLSVPDQGDAWASGSAAALIKSVPRGCNTVIHFSTPGAYPVTSVLDFPQWTTVHLVNGAYFDVHAGARVTIDGSIDSGPYKIFSGEGNVAGAPKIDAALPEWFGAVANDQTDDHVPLQKAFGLFAVVQLQSGIYDVGATVDMPSGSSLQGPLSAAPNEPTAVLRARLVYPACDSGACGFHPVRMLQTSPNANGIVLRDLTLDGHRSAGGATSVGNYPQSDNLARFQGVTNLLLERCVLKSYEANWGTSDPTLFHVIAILGSTDITLRDVNFFDSRVEGILFKDSQNIFVQRLRAKNSTVWTPLHAQHVNNFTLVDSTIVDDEGRTWSASTINVAAHGARIANNYFQGGWGLDFGDEGATELFGPADITVEDNTIESMGSSLYFTPLFRNDLVQNVIIRRNTIKTHRLTPELVKNSESQVIRFDAAATVLVADNTLDVPSGGSLLIRGIHFAGETRNITIRDNRFTGIDTGIGIKSDGRHENSIAIANNTIICAPNFKLDSWNGGSTGVYIHRRADYSSTWFNSIVVDRNNISAEGGWVTLIDDQESIKPPFVDSIAITNNIFAPDNDCLREITLSGNAAYADAHGNVPNRVKYP